MTEQSELMKHPLAKGQRSIKANLRRRTDSQRCPGDGERTNDSGRAQSSKQRQYYSYAGRYGGKFGRVTKSTPRKRADRRWTPGDGGRWRTSDAGRTNTAILYTLGDTPGVMLGDAQS